jgi:hypothetical protein
MNFMEIIKESLVKVKFGDSRNLSSDQFWKISTTQYKRWHQMDKSTTHAIYRKFFADDFSYMNFKNPSSYATRAHPSPKA